MTGALEFMRLSVLRVDALGRASIYHITASVSEVFSGKSFALHICSSAKKKIHAVGSGLFGRF